MKTYRKWTVTLTNGKTQVYTEDGDNVQIDGTSTVYPLPVFWAGLDKMRAAGGTITETITH